MPAASRTDHAVASTKLGLLPADVYACPPLEDEDHLLDTVVAVRGGAGSGVAQLLHDAERLGAGCPGRVKSREHAGPPFDEGQVPHASDKHWAR